MRYLHLSSVAIGQSFVPPSATVNKPVNMEGRKEGREEGTVVATAIKTPLHYA